MKDDCEAPIELLYSCRMQSSMCAHQVWLAYSVVQVFCFLDLLYSCSIHYWKWDAKVSNYHYWIVYFSLNLFIFALFILALLLDAYMFITVISSQQIYPFITIKCPFLALITFLRSLSFSTATPNSYDCSLHNTSFSILSTSFYLWIESMSPVGCIELDLLKKFNVTILIPLFILYCFLLH